MPERNWRKRMRRRIMLRITILLLILALAAAAIWVFVLPYRNAQSSMPLGGQLTLEHLPTGEIKLSWPEAQRQDYYQIEVWHQVELEDEDGKPYQELQLLNSGTMQGDTACLMEDFPMDEALTIRVNTMVRYDFPGEDRYRPGDKPLEMTVNLTPPAVTDLEWTPDPETDTMTLQFSRIPGDKVRLWWKDEQDQWQLLRTLDQDQTQITFGPNADLPLPEHDQKLSFYLDSYREIQGGIYYGHPSDMIYTTREDYLDRNLWVQLTDEGENLCSLIWNETKGEYYEVQMKVDEAGEWTTIHTVDKAGKRVFSTEHLQAFRTYSFRVVAQGGQNLEGMPAAISKIQEFKTAEAVLYSTIWPIKELKVYAEPGMTTELGKVAGGTTLCVVEDHGDVFGIRWDDGVTGYLDSRYVMIDLAEYLGPLCAYDITNSYSSRYMINKYDIPDVTDEIIVGYEKVRLGDGSYVVPLLYPVAQRLKTAALSAWEAGYRLKIYDSYRPNRATVVLYNTAEELLEEPVPGDIPDPTEEDPERLLTYGSVMTDDGKYPLNYFLAKGASLHNLGIALDLTIEKRDTGVEQPMQTKMHDLSYYSMIYRNPQNANILKGFMEGAGFGGLVSEWWHFQDNDIRKELTLPALWGGVSPEGWKLSDGGWRYRLSDGSYAADGTVSIGGKDYSFDAEGYLKETA